MYKYFISVPYLYNISIHISTTKDLPEFCGSGRSLLLSYMNL
ncbi:hypothetical protein ANACAC_02593 [Anaerostipes caccae L1-92]|uniref:Uncharacterized protein n=1 Tax=Anaerostipes caccae (strain DSM 14662 / CCUG 47493 / JCM 13470 / NCIMB 13811 / L1-92) TaxID=411490 RepID=B0MG84_ANACD|nr:hypothetical protein ANACAC_02593 [Anaerostipes caccae L1-92]